MLVRVLAAIAALVTALVCACTIQGACDAIPTVDYCNPDKDSGIGECHGRLLDPLTWESNPSHSDWLNFPPNTPIYMQLRDGTTNQKFAGQVYEITPYVSSDPSRNGSDTVVASGNPAIIGYDPGCGSGTAATTCITIHNETCAPLFVRVVVHGVALPDAGVQDSGSDAPNDSGDAGD